MDFKDIITNSLENSGILDNIRAELRGEIYENIKVDGFMLDECKKINDDDVAAWLFKDFLEKSNAEHTLKTFIKEADLKPHLLAGQKFLSKFDLKSENSSPVIYDIIAKFHETKNKAKNI